MEDVVGKGSVADSLAKMDRKNKNKEVEEPVVEETVEVEDSAKPVEPMAIEEPQEELNPKETIANFLDVGGIKRATNLSNVKEIELELLDVEALEVPEINDSKGYLSSKVRDFMNTYNVSVVPLDALGFSSRVKSLRDYQLSEMGGKRFASSVNTTNDRSRVLNFANSLRDKYANSGVVDESVMQNIVVNGKTYRTVQFNHYELRLLKSTLRNFGFVCYEDLNGDIRVNIGGESI